jgi:hypothetical protein
MISLDLWAWSELEAAGASLPATPDRPASTRTRTDFTDRIANPPARIWRAVEGVTGTDARRFAHADAST